MKYLILSILVALTSGVFSQSENESIAAGNDLYRQEKYGPAEMQYRTALKTNPKSLQAKYNLANSLMMQKKYQEAISLYDELTTGPNKEAREAAYYNAGVGYTKQKDLEQSIEYYKNALRTDPDDQMARENLQKALSELKKQQSSSSQQNKSKSKMNPQQADNKLKQLEQKEQQVQKRMAQQAPGKGGTKTKDW
jgi:Ca-activated chloride channel homolog